MNREQMFRAEPELKRIIDRAADHRRDSYPEKNRHYVNFKREADPLVGFAARNPDLRDERAWRIFNNALTEAMRL